MNKHILIIDEGRLMCYGLKKALAQEQLEVDAAYTVQQALATFTSNKYDLCLFDLCPPDEKGFELLGVIRKAWPGMEIILMSANDISLYDDQDTIIHKARESGACHLLCKPFDLKLLKVVVFHILSEGCDAPWLRENFFISCRRKAPRETYCKQLNYSLRVIKDGATRQLNIPGESVNLSKDGIRLITPYLLRPADVISFDDEELGRKQGVVVWSSQFDDDRYKAGIRFA